jgi:kynurenine formamidase
MYDLSQPLNERCSFWPYYPPFEVKYIKRKAEHGVNAQYIQTSNHMGTHLDAPRHFVRRARRSTRSPSSGCGTGNWDCRTRWTTGGRQYAQMIEKRGSATVIS